jgi:hypothetical protein
MKLMLSYYSRSRKAIGQTETGLHQRINDGYWQSSLTATAAPYWAPPEDVPTQRGSGTRSGESLPYRYSISRFGPIVSAFAKPLRTLLQGATYGPLRGQPTDQARRSGVCAAAARENRSSKAARPRSCVFMSSPQKTAGSTSSETEKAPTSHQGNRRVHTVGSGASPQVNVAGPCAVLPFHRHAISEPVEPVLVRCGTVACPNSDANRG